MIVLINFTSQNSVQKFNTFDITQNRSKTINMEITGEQIYRNALNIKH